MKIDQLPQPERHWYRPPTPPRPAPVTVQAPPPALTPAQPAAAPAQQAGQHPAGTPWWVWVLVVLALPLIVCLLPFYWLAKAIAAAFYGFTLPWFPHRIPDRYRNHGRSS